MIDIKTKEEIGLMRQGGKILAQVLFEVLAHVKPGVSEIELDRLAEKLIKKKRAEPGFKRVSGYNHTICTSVNDIIVHGIPTEYRLKEGDVVGIDCGVYCRGFHTDAAHTVRVQNAKFPPEARLAKGGKVQNDEIDKFLNTGEQALWEAIKIAKVGNRVGHISKTIQDIVEGAGYTVVRSLVGHGVGRQLHEEPEVPGFLAGNIDQTVELKDRMTIAIEVIANTGAPDVVLGEDGWTIRTKDGSLSSLFERTVAITRSGPIVLTQ